MAFSYMAILLLHFIPEWLDSWANYPGLELWKFANLLIFLVVAFLLHRRFGRPIREAFRSRGEGIKQEIARAEQQRDAALAQLSEIEARFGALDDEIASIREKAAK